MGDVIRIDRVTLTGDAVTTPEGYLEVDAYLARDGLLRYSDGASSWLEYRPAAELEAAAATWANQPVTDDHPPGMLTAANVSTYARGHVIGTPTIEVRDGVTYLRGRLRITDAGLRDKILAGRRELSIGFVADVVPQRGVWAGDRYDAVQTSLVGNHVASVDRGRAGPECRVMLDSAQVPIACYDPPRMADVKSPRVIKLPPGTKMDKLTAWCAHLSKTLRADEVGLPTTMAKLVGPDGTEVEVPTWVAALVAEALDAHKAAQAAEPAAPPEPPEAEAMTEAETDPAADPAAKPKPKPEDETMTPDAIAALVRKRGRLERLAQSAGVPSAVIDSADDVTLSRAIVCARMPAAKALADSASGERLESLVEAAALQPATVPANPFEVRRAVADADADAEHEIEVYATMIAG